MFSSLVLFVQNETKKWSCDAILNLETEDECVIIPVFVCVFVCLFVLFVLFVCMSVLLLCWSFIIAAVLMW